MTQPPMTETKVLSEEEKSDQRALERAILKCSDFHVYVSGAQLTGVEAIVLMRYLDTLQAAESELMALRAKLPATADGVSITPAHGPVFDANGNEHCVVWHVDSGEWAHPDVEGEEHKRISVHSLYSTRAAALAANAPGEGKGE